MATISLPEIGFHRYLWRSLSWNLQTRILHQQLSFILPTGIEFPLPSESPLARDIYLTQNNIDGNATCLITRYLQEQNAEGVQGDFFDIGANIGYYTALLSPLMRRTYAFEPDQGHHVYLSPLLITTGNARLIPQAVADFIGLSRLQVSGHADQSYLVTAPDAPTTGTMEVEVISVDEFCRTHPDASPSLIKIDTEGFEIAALEGAIRTTHQFQPLFFLEYPIMANRPNDLPRLRDFINTTKYRAYTLSRQMNRFQLKEWPPQLSLPDQLKMIFLAPPNDRFFSNLAKNFPQELQTLMTPRQVHQYLGF